MSISYALKEHREWIGILQPVGLVVAASALENAQLRLQKDVFNLQETFCSITNESKLSPLYFTSLFTKVLGWRTEDLISADESLNAYLPERESLLKADYAVKNIDSGEFDILIKYIDQLSFDDEEEVEGRGWQATPHAKFERHLREKTITIGVLVNQFGLRLVYAPKGETSGYVTFPFSFMRETQGRSVLAAFHLLLGEDRIFKGDPKQRLQYLLVESRKFQNEVSTQLSEQVLAALYELVRGFQEANDESKGKLLEKILKEDKNHVYHGLLTVLLRIVFTLYAEDRDLISNDTIFLNNYSINGLFVKLRGDFNKHQDSMNLRYGAWAHLLSLFRLIFEGAELESDSIPGRKGHLFDPDRFTFLEGRIEVENSFNPPRVSDFIVWKVLSNLMMLKDERISYRALDVEQIGSVYETVMGFKLEEAKGSSIAIRSVKAHGAPVIVNLEEILFEKSEKRITKLKEVTDQKFDGKVAEAIKNAKTPDDLVMAMGKKVAEWASPMIIHPGAMILQPGNERRRSGSHYTPRTLTAPIVEKSLQPILRNLGEDPTPDQILNLKICDPAMGSGAFLVEACRQLSEHLVRSWARHKVDIREEIPVDEDELLYARRLIAQRCLYGVDKNPMAVNLAKLSLWLVTFAKMHDFTFLDHCLKSGDSLIGLNLNQVASFSYDEKVNPSLSRNSIVDKIRRATKIRTAISNQKEEKSSVLSELSKQAEDLINDLKIIGDTIIYSFFKEQNKKKRVELLDTLSLKAENWFSSGTSHLISKTFESEIRELHATLVPFHWEIEFPELFVDGKNVLTCMIGNPPFLGGKKIRGVLGDQYTGWITSFYSETRKNSDIVAFFFRRCFDLISDFGVVGLISTNTLSQGDTRYSSLRHILKNKGIIFSAVRRLRWPGEAAVIVSVVHIFKGVLSNFEISLDYKKVDKITAFLFHSGSNEDPLRLTENKGKAFVGSVLMGTGFSFDESSTSTETNSYELMNQLIKKDPKNSEKIFPYIGGEEVNSHPQHLHNRHVINFGELTLQEANEWPDLIEVLKDKVKPGREKLAGTKDAEKYKEKWWLFGRSTPGLYKAISKLQKVLVMGQTSKYRVLTFMPTNYVFDQKLIVFAFDDFASLCLLQSRFHEVWSIFMGSTMKDDPVYTPTDCFLPFPFPRYFKINESSLASAGEAYFNFRKVLLVEENIGLTKLYNRFHDPNESDARFLQLRELHKNLDIAVLNAYGWTDLNLEYDFGVEYEEADEVESTKSSRMKPWRYAWNDITKNEVIVRLMELNQQLGLAQGAEIVEEEDEI